MSSLLIDLGNTRWKLGLSGPEAPQFIAQGDQDDLDLLDREIAQVAVGAEQVLFASVAESGLTQRVRRTLQFQKLPVHQILSTDEFPGLVIGYIDPSQLGVDRALAMLAVRAHWFGPFCVIDAGTAVTIDFVDADGQHLGGFILPGRTLARDCLLRGTAIPADVTTDDSALLGRDTAGAISLGGRYAVAGVVRQAMTLPALTAFAEAGRVFVGGGDAASVEALLPGPVQRIEQPVLLGLNRLAEGRQV